MMSGLWESGCLMKVPTLSSTVFGNKPSAHMLWSTFKIITRMEIQTEVCAEVSKMGEEVWPGQCSACTFSQVACAALALD